MLAPMAIQTAAARVLDDKIVAGLIARITASGEVTRDIDTPFTGDRLATLPISAVTDVETDYAKARAAQEAWAALPASERAKPFLKFVDALVERREEILDILQLETGKARRHAFEEFLDVALAPFYSARRAAKLLKPKRRQGALPIATKTYELRQPKGVIGMITPWNYPISMGVGDTVPALLAGNGVVHKPDTQTSLSVMWCVQLLIDCGLPAD